MHLHGIGCPDDQSVDGNGSVEGSHVLAPGLHRVAAVESKVPDDDQESNAGNRVVAPLLSGVLVAESSKQAHQDHDDVGNDCHQNVCTAQASKDAQVKQEQRRSESPIHIAGPEDLTADQCVGPNVNIVVVLVDLGLVDADALASGHHEVRDGGNGGNGGRDDMV